MKYVMLQEIPKLSWLAVACDNNELLVYHGSAVECKPEWMVEGVWGGDFSEGNFHASESFFGSGIRIDGESIYFVASSSVQDRLVYCLHDNKMIVSNSLPLLLGFTGARLDDSHDYVSEAYSIIDGIRVYKREFTVVHAEIPCFYQIFYENVIFSKGKISYETRFKRRKIQSYEQYCDELANILGHMRRNYEDPTRKYKVRAFSTLSSGYDSTAITCLLKNIGVDTSFSIKRSNSVLPQFFERGNDSGERAARDLNIKMISLEADLRSITEDELYYLSSYVCPKGQGCVVNQLKYDPMAKYIEKECEVAVVFGATHGDLMWDCESPERVHKDDILRGDATGCDLMEIRLKSGFINVAVPFILAINIIDVQRITKSEEMLPWRVFNDYDRPIPRRIAEAAGVKKESFAIRKKAIITAYHYPINKTLRKRFFEHLRRVYNLSSVFVYSHIFINRLPYWFKKLFMHVGVEFHNYTQSYFFPQIDIPFLLWVWANHTMSNDLAGAFRGRNDFEALKIRSDIGSE
jgi:hypothetical protein